MKGVATGHAVFSDGTMMPTRCVVWGGGIKAAAVAADGGLAEGRGGRVDVQADLTLPNQPDDVYVIGDIANIPGPDGKPLPQARGSCQPDDRDAGEDRGVRGLGG